MPVPNVSAAPSVTPHPAPAIATATPTPVAPNAAATPPPAAGTATDTTKPRNAAPFVDRLDKERQLQMHRRAIADDQAKLAQQAAALKTREDAWRAEQQTASQKAADDAKRYDAWRKAQELAEKNPLALLDASKIDRQKLLAMLTEEAITGKPPEVPLDARFDDYRATVEQELQKLREDNEKRWNDQQTAAQKAQQAQQEAAQREAQEQIDSHRDRVRKWVGGSAAKFELMGASADDAADLMNEIIETQAMETNEVMPYDEAAGIAETMIENDMRTLLKTGKGRTIALQIAKAAGWTEPASQQAAPTEGDATMAPSPPIAPAQTRPTPRPPSTISSADLPRGTPAAPIRPSVRSPDERMAKAKAAYDAAQAMRRRMAGVAE